MRAAIIKRYGPPEVVRISETPAPQAKAGEILVKICAATVATADCEARTFSFQRWMRPVLRLMFGVFRPRKPLQILGQELSGEVAAIGAGVSNFKPGDAIFAAVEGFGAHADYICIPADSAVAIKPPALSHDEAATFTVFALNALHFIDKAALTPQSKILINGAGGSIGTVAVQLAKHIGAEVTAVDSAGKLDVLKEIGADHVIDYNAPDFTQTGFTQTGFTQTGAVYDVILDVIGKAPFKPSLKALTSNGRYILANPMLAPMLRGLLTNMISTRRVYFALAGYKRENLLRLRTLAQSGDIKAVIDRRFRFDDIADAHRYVESGRKTGHVTLTFPHAG